MTYLRVLTFDLTLEHYQIKYYFSIHKIVAPLYIWIKKVVSHFVWVTPFFDGAAMHREPIPVLSQIEWVNPILYSLIFTH